MAPDSEVALRQELAAAIAAFLDQVFVDPAVAPTAANPGSVTNAITPLAPSGTTSAAAAADVDKLIGQFLTQNPGTSSTVLLMTPSVASMLVSATKVQTLTINGGSYAGVPVVTSGHVGARIVMLDASAILYADAGVEIDMSRHATIALNDAPDNPVVAATVLTPLWQNNLVGLRAERVVNWKRSRTSAVALVSPVAYAPGS
jgi:hypothetical protein